MNNVYDSFESLKGDFDSFSSEHQDRRLRYIKTVMEGYLPMPLPEWTIDRGDEVGGDAASLHATTVYNVLVDSYFKTNDNVAGGLPQIIEYGGNAELWTLIRIAMDETHDEDVANFCRARGFRVLRLVSAA